MDNPGALSGITVIDLSRLLPGPYCSMVLADHGARVIAVEDRRFQTDAFFISAVMRNKQHMTLNLKSDEGRKIFYRLVQAADVVIEGFRPGVVQRLEVDYNTLSRINPRIVCCSITGYGQSGPLRDRAGHDVNYLAHCGVLDLIGEAGRSPCIPGIQMADIAGGSQQAVAGILLALLAREKTGRGQHVDISMTDGMLGFLAIPFFLRQRDGSFPQRGDAMLSHRYGCYNIYETADGRHISIGAVERRFWKQLCECLQLTEYIDLQYDDRRRNEIIDALRRIFREKSLAQWEDRLKKVDACWAAVRTVEEVVKDPHFRQRQMIADAADDPAGGGYAPGIAVKLGSTPGSVRKRPPGFGQDTDAVLSELGYSEEKIRSLKRKEVV
ncbi:MAG: carnitine dehydratase [Deltaproteobacteria bacterium SG8_13]|nr:MAG: carnitine dehydratase [Deltaproteobacteria bacterium SG8_13]